MALAETLLQLQLSKFKSIPDSLSPFSCHILISLNTAFKPHYFIFQMMEFII